MPVEAISGSRLGNFEVTHVKVIPTRGFYVLAFPPSENRDLVFVRSLVNGKKIVQSNGQRGFNNEKSKEIVSIELMDV